MYTLCCLQAITLGAIGVAAAAEFYDRSAKVGTHPLVYWKPWFAALGCLRADNFIMCSLACIQIEVLPYCRPNCVCADVKAKAVSLVLSI